MLYGLVRTCVIITVSVIWYLRGARAETRRGRSRNNSDDRPRTACTKSCPESAAGNRGLNSHISAAYTIITQRNVIDSSVTNAPTSHKVIDSLFRIRMRQPPRKRGFQ